jgi:branched-subunit amino acid transport protein
MTEMIPLDYIILLLGMGLVTYIPRWLPLFFLTRYRLSGFFVEWLELIPVSILSALLLPALITKGNPRVFEIFQPEMWVSIPTVIFALWTRSLGGTVIAGMLFFWLVEKLF